MWGYLDLSEAAVKAWLQHSSLRLAPNRSCMTPVMFQISWGMWNIINRKLLSLDASDFNANAMNTQVQWILNTVFILVECKLKSICNYSFNFHVISTSQKANFFVLVRSFLKHSKGYLKPMRTWARIASVTFGHIYIQVNFDQEGSQWHDLYMYM